MLRIEIYEHALQIVDISLLLGEFAEETQENTLALHQVENVWKLCIDCELLLSHPGISPHLVKNLKKVVSSQILLTIRVFNQFWSLRYVVLDKIVLAEVLFIHFFLILLLYSCVFNDILNFSHRLVPLGRKRILLHQVTALLQDLFQTKCVVPYQKPHENHINFMILFDYLEPLLNKAPLNQRSIIDALFLDFPHCRRGNLLHYVFRAMTHLYKFWLSKKENSVVLVNNLLEELKSFRR